METEIEAGWFYAVGALFVIVLAIDVGVIGYCSGGYDHDAPVWGSAPAADGVVASRDR